MHNINRTPAA